jgi:LacI family sucrose operon transcriptional repressor
VVESAFQTHPDVDGVFGADLYAMACLHHALEHGRRVPGDLRIVSYDGTNATQFMTPSLTTVCQPFQALAEASVRLVLQLIQGEPVEEKRLTLPVTIRRGQSTGIA